MLISHMAGVLTRKCSVAFGAIWAREMSILTYYEAGLKHDPSHGEADVNSVEMEKSEYRLQ